MKISLETRALWALLLPSSSAWAAQPWSAEEIADPLAHFAEAHALYPDDRVVRIDADIDGDGFSRS